MNRKRLETALMAGILLALLGILLALTVEQLAAVDAQAAEQSAARAATTFTPEAAELPEAELEEAAELPEERASSYPLTDEEFYAVCAVVMAECGGEPYEGQIAVAQCIRNACELDQIDPIYVLNHYGYAKPTKTWTESVSKAVNAVFWLGEKAVDEPIRYFYAPRLSKGQWHEQKREFVCEIGGHRFFK